MSGLTLEFRGLSGSITVPVNEGDTVADAREAAGISPDLSIRQNGEAVADDSLVNSEAPYVTTPPDAKHGRL